MLELLEQMHSAWVEQEKAHTDMAKIQAHVNNVFQSKLTDLSLIPQLYDWYQDCTLRNNFISDSHNHNKQFVFIMLMLYSPRSLYGAEIKRGLRKSIAAAININEDTALYRMRSKAAIWIKTYKAFSSEVTIAFDEIMNRLHAHGIIEP